MRCPTCGEENANMSRFCGNCGQPLALKCSACGQAVPTGNKFCPACGARVSNAPPPVGPAAPLAAAPPSYGPPAPAATAQAAPPLPPAAATYATRTVSAWPSTGPVGAPPAATPPSNYGQVAPPTYGPAGYGPAAYAPPPAAPAYGPSQAYGPPPVAQYGVAMAPEQGSVGGQWAQPGYGGFAAPLRGVVVYKGLGPRFVAMLLDGVIVGVPAYLLMMLLFSAQLTRMTYGNTGAMTGPYLFMMALNLAYATLLEAGGGTLGKRIVGLKVIDVQGAKPGLGKALVRNVVKFVDMLPGIPLVGIIAIASSDTKQRVGDRVAKTYVVAK